jgi:hypothetical protein
MPDIVRPSELETARRWLNEAFLGPAIDPSRFPVSFHYGDDGPIGSMQCEPRSRLEDWTLRREPARPEQGVTSETVVADAFGIVLTDARTGLVCRCEIKAYADFPAVEWVVYFKNTGETNTPILSDIQSLDMRVPLDTRKACQVHHGRGGPTQTDNFAPLETPPHD